MSTTTTGVNWRTAVETGDLAASTDAANYQRLREAVGELLHIAHMRREVYSADTAPIGWICRMHGAWEDLEAAYDATPTASAEPVGVGLLSEGDGRTDPFAP